MKKLICLSACLFMGVAMLGCYEYALECNEKIFVPRRDDEYTLRVCSYGEQVLVKCPSTCGNNDSGSAECTSR